MYQTTPVLKTACTHQFLEILRLEQVRKMVKDIQTKAESDYSISLAGQLALFTDTLTSTRLQKTAKKQRTCNFWASKGINRNNYLITFCIYFILATFGQNPLSFSPSDPHSLQSIAFLKLPIFRRRQDIEKKDIVVMPFALLVLAARVGSLRLMLIPICCHNKLMGYVCFE